MNARRTTAGFTLLEVMCAFMVLALVIGYTTWIWRESIDKARVAIDKRELRERADTVFGKVLFEEHEWQDGQTGTLAEAYGEWAGLRSAQRDRLRIYRYELLKKRVTAAGVAGEDSDAEDLFNQDEEEDEVPRSEAEEGVEGEGGGIELWKYTLKIFLEAEGAATEDELNPLITLQTFRRVSDTLENRR